VKKARQPAAVGQVGIGVWEVFLQPAKSGPESKNASKSAWILDFLIFIRADTKKNTNKRKSAPNFKAD